MNFFRHTKIQAPDKPWVNEMGYCSPWYLFYQKITCFIFCLWKINTCCAWKWDFSSKWQTYVHAVADVQGWRFHMKDKKNQLFFSLNEFFWKLEHTAIVTKKTKIKTIRLWLISLAWASVVKPCFLVEIYSLTIQLQILGLGINN